MGLVNLDALPQFIAVNRQNYHAYVEAFASIGGLTLLEYDEALSPNYQYVVIEVSPDFQATRDEVVAALQAENVLARKYFWPGCHRMRPYRELFPQAGLVLKNTHYVAKRIIVLPTRNGLSIEALTSITEMMQVAGIYGIK